MVNEEGKVRREVIKEERKGEKERNGKGRQKGRGKTSERK